MGEDGQQQKAVSYCYFASSIDHSIPAAKPQQITEQEALEQQWKLEQQRIEQGASAWNHAGTFEERDRTAWAKERLTAIVVGSCGPIAVQSVKECRGSANTWIVRNKRRHGFDFELSLAWALSVGGREVQGVAKIPNAASDELDDLSLELLDAASAQTSFEPAVSKLLRQHLPGHVSAALAALLEELQQK